MHPSAVDKNHSRAWIIALYFHDLNKAFDGSSHSKDYWYRLNGKTHDILPNLDKEENMMLIVKDVLPLTNSGSRNLLEGGGDIAKLFKVLAPQKRFKNNFGKVGQ